MPACGAVGGDQVAGEAEALAVSGDGRAGNTGCLVDAAVAVPGVQQLLNLLAHLAVEAGHRVASFRLPVSR
jgi:hypothetical protein